MMVFVEKFSSNRATAPSIKKANTEYLQKRHAYAQGNVPAGLEPLY